MNFLLLDWWKINLWQYCLVSKSLTRSTRTRHTATSKRFHTIRVDSLSTTFVLNYLAFSHCFYYNLTTLTRVWTMCPSRIWSTSTRMCVWLLLPTLNHDQHVTSNVLINFPKWPSKLSKSHTLSNGTNLTEGTCVNHHAMTSARTGRFHYTEPYQRVCYCQCTGMNVTNLEKL